MNVEDKSRNSDDSEQVTDGSFLDCLLAVIQLFLVLSVLIAFISVFVLSIYFLYVDKGKGGECADTYGHNIWVYFFWKLIIGCCSQVLTGGFSRFGKNDVDADGNPINKNTTTTSGTIVSGLVLVMLINIGILIYGGIVLVHDPVCDQYTNTGLYKMAYAMFFIDSVMLGLLSFFGCCIGAQSQDNNAEAAAEVTANISSPLVKSDVFQEA